MARIANIEIERLRNVQAVLIYCPSGLGDSSPGLDPPWEAFLKHVISDLSTRGYKTELIRAGRLQIPGSWCFPGGLVRQIKAITEINPRLNIILFGRSTGAVNAERTLAYFPDSQRIYAIEASRPCRNLGGLVVPGRTFEITNPQDPLEEGNLWHIFKAGFPPRVSVTRWSDGRRLRVGIYLPGHDRTNYSEPDILKALTGFLDTHFPYLAPRQS
jgi:pimeloyl-ACP methyl ester carboxylesterase